MFLTLAPYHGKLMLSGLRNTRGRRLICLPGFVLVLCALLFAFFPVFSQTSATDFVTALEKEKLSEHLSRVQRLLPPHSGLPPLLNLSQAETPENRASRVWEDRFTGIMGVREITDPGIPVPSEATSVLLTTNEYVGLYALPAHNCDGVVIAKPIACNVHLAYNRRFVYSNFTMQVAEVLKRKKRPGLQKGEQILAAQFGGRIRFPSGHVETCILANEGFMELGKEYLIFIWQPVRSDETYVVSEAYLMQNDSVFPIKTFADVSTYNGMPVETFEAKVKAAIAKNVDSN